MTEFKGTKGIAEVCTDLVSHSYISVGDIKITQTGTMFGSTSDSNAELICEAFNVANETNLTPIQLKEQLDESCKALSDVMVEKGNLITENAQLKERLDEANEILSNVMMSLKIIDSMGIDSTIKTTVQLRIKELDTFLSENETKTNTTSERYIYLVHDSDNSCVLSAHLTEEEATKESSFLRKDYAPSVVFNVSKIKITEQTKTK